MYQKLLPILVGVKFVIWFCQASTPCYPNYPLPITSLGYQRCLYFPRPITRTLYGTKYALVMAQHFSKWIELVVSPQNSFELVVVAFLLCFSTIWATCFGVN